MKKRAVGSFKPHQSTPIKGATIVKADLMAIERMNRTLRKKCAEQRKCDAMTSIIAQHFIAK